MSFRTRLMIAHSRRQAHRAEEAKKAEKKREEEKETLEYSTEKLKVKNKSNRQLENAAEEKSTKKKPKLVESKGTPKLEPLVQV